MKTVIIIAIGLKILDHFFSFSRFFLINFGNRDISFLRWRDQSSTSKINYFYHQIYVYVCSYAGYLQLASYKCNLVILSVHDQCQENVAIP